MITYACDMSKKTACWQNLEKKIILIPRVVRPHNEKNALEGNSIPHVGDVT